LTSYIKDLKRGPAKKCQGAMKKKAVKQAEPNHMDITCRKRAVTCHSSLIIK